MTSQEFIDQAEQLLHDRQDHELKRLLKGQDFHTIADVIDALDHGKRKTFTMLPPEVQAEVVLRLSEGSKDAILHRLSDDIFARFLHFNDEDDAADILQSLPEQRRDHILPLLKDEKRMNIDRLLRYGPETAGGIMDLNFIVITLDTPVKDVLQQMQAKLTTHKHAPVVVVQGRSGKAEGYVPHRNLLFAPQGKSVEQITRSLPVIIHTTDREHLLELMSSTKTDVAGVTDEKDRVLGIIHLRDLLKVAEAEATEDLYKFAGVSKEEQVLDPPLVAVRMRYRWLLINLGTAFIAAFVVSLFEDTISRLAVLAAYMPIVAGMGGNAGTQTLAVVVRGLALGEATDRHAWRILRNQAVVGFLNGLLNGLVVMLIIGWVMGTPKIGAVLGLAMVINLTVSGVAGSLIPIVLRRLKVDPAIASTVFVTTATDVCGFLAFLGLATILL